VGCTTGLVGGKGDSSNRIHLGEGERRSAKGGEGEKSSDDRRL
jgi:hypothetical protein